MIRGCMAGLIFVTALSTSIMAAAPDVKSVFPSGGAVGSMIEVEATGAIGQPGTSVWFSQPGLSAEIPESGGKLKITVSPDAAPGLVLMRFHNAEGSSGLMPFVISRLPDVRDTEPNNSPVKAQKLEGPAVVHGKLGESGDVDVFAIAATKGQTIVAQADANWRLGSAADMVLQVLHGDGSVIEQVDDDRGNDPLIAFEVPADGVYLIRAFAFPAQPDSSVRFAGGATFTYRLTVTTGPFVDHALPSVVPVDRETPLKLTGWNLPDELRQITIPAGGLAAFRSPAFAEPLPVESSDLPVLLEADPSDRTTPQPIEPRCVVCGVIGAPRDEDWFSLKVTKGQKLKFDVESRQLGYPLDPVLQVFGADNKVLAESDDEQRGSPDVSLKYTAAADGEIRLRLRDVFGHGGGRYAWRLKVQPLEPTVLLTAAVDRFVVKPDAPAEVIINIARNDGFGEELLVSADSLPAGLTCEPVKSESKGDSSKQVKLMLKTDGSAAFHGPIRFVAKVGDRRFDVTHDLPTFRTSTMDLWLTAVAKPAEPPKAAEPEKTP